MMPTHKSDKRSISPHRFPLLRSGSVSSRSTTPNTSRPTTPSSAPAKKRVTLPSLENQHPCVSRLKRKIPKTLNNIPAKVSVSSKPYLAGANQRKMKCYILTWTNIESKSDEDKKAKGGDKE
ncbi:hypothetical protein NC652_028980 [Populus alba x Populus x berolinensis]|nr:hypothetical protein NC652_028980 [Populus alba x Populus x berolinensis]